MNRCLTNQISVEKIGFWHLANHRLGSLLIIILIGSFNSTGFGHTKKQFYQGWFAHTQTHTKHPSIKKHSEHILSAKFDNKILV